MCAETPCPKLSAKDRRDAIWSEIVYRREKQWNIFAWAATLLLGAAGWIATLTFKEGQELSKEQKGTLIAALGILTLYAAVWVSINVWREEEATKKINKLDEKLGTANPEGILDSSSSLLSESKGFLILVGYAAIILLLGCAAGIAVWFSAPHPRTLSLSIQPGVKPEYRLNIPGRQQDFEDLKAAETALETEAGKATSLPPLSK
jgi:hypothetical protein